MKKTSVTFTWTPDSSKTDMVYIVCTIVQQKTTYWVKQYIEIDYAGTNQCTPDGDVRGLPTSCSDSSTCDTQFTSSVCDTTADADGQCVCPSDMEVAGPTHTYCSPKGLPKACSDRNSCDVFFKWSICDANADDDGQCVCPSNMKIADASNKYCSPKTLNDVCTSTSDCGGVANAECIEGRCKLNVCTANTDCTGTNGNQCVEGKCTSGARCTLFSMISLVVCCLFLYCQNAINS
ncbi:prestalk protein-like [Ruditapes philippinarum]|uniref:prestalk protein-like n=1 Tax=Ruditapes philippinarum TaxID=129788 RepID=UPI00295B151D|nr:prestalk protein-like [Ruditapes philippinarum]